MSDFILALSHLIDLNKENDYERAIKATKLPIILDNGVFENTHPESIQSLVDKALKINAESIFAPDILYNRIDNEAAFENTYSYLDEISEVNKPRLNIVIQADNMSDYIDSYFKFVHDDRVNLIGLSILAIPKCFAEITKTNDITTNRIKCLQYLNMFSIHKNSHLLGAGSSYQDIKYATTNCPWVVSHDSSGAFWNGLHGKRILPDLSVSDGKTNVKVNFNYNKSLTVEQRDNILHNINIIKGIKCK